MIRTGLFIRQYLLDHTEESVAVMHRALKEQITMENQRRTRSERLRGPTYSSFLKYIHNLARLGLVELSGHEEPAEFVATDKLVQIRGGSGGKVVPSVRRFFRITAKGRSEVRAWQNPIKALGYQRHIGNQ